MSDKAKLLIARNYVDAICLDDISRVDDVQRLRTGADLVLHLDDGRYALI